MYLDILDPAGLPTLASEKIMPGNTIVIEYYSPDDEAMLDRFVQIRTKQPTTVDWQGFNYLAYLLTGWDAQHQQKVVWLAAPRARWAYIPVPRTEAVPA